MAEVQEEVTLYTTENSSLKTNNSFEYKSM
jgi:hypothetical protein